MVAEVESTSFIIIKTASPYRAMGLAILYIFGVAV